MTLLVLLAAANFLAPQAPPPATPSQTCGPDVSARAFTKADANGDGALELAEVLGLPVACQDFAMDMNGDLRVQHQEYLEAEKVVQAGPRPIVQGHPGILYGPPSCTDGRAAFNRADANHDFLLQPAEVSALVVGCRAFAVDRNGDGFVVFQEYAANVASAGREANVIADPALHQPSATPKPAAVCDASQFTLADANEDLVLQISEVNSVLWECRDFAVDRNGDSVVEMAEYLGAIARYNRPARPTLNPTPGSRRGVEVIDRDTLDSHGVTNIQDLDRYLESIGAFSRGF